jgi:hypothetical protein
MFPTETAFFLITVSARVALMPRRTNFAGRSDTSRPTRSDHPKCRRPNASDPCHRRNNPFGQLGHHARPDIFSGLAWAIIFGILTSTLFTLIVIPIVSWLLYGKSSLVKGETPNS